MKTILFLVIFPFFTITSFGQGFIPIPDTLAVWRQSFSAMEFSDKYQIYTAEKTTIDSFIYTVLRMTGNSNHYGTSIGYTDSLFGFLRNDTLNERVLFRKNITDSVDEILYDFNINIGDTIPSTWVGNNWVNVIDEIDTVWMYGQARRRLSFSDYSFIPGAAGAIIEGVGSVLGFARGLTIPYEPAWAALECFSYKDSAYSFSSNTPPSNSHPTYEGSSCWLYSDINEFEKDAFIQVFPNPFSNEITFTSESNEQAFITLYNFFGQQVFQHTLTNFLTIKTEQLSAGIYFYEISNSNGELKTGKVIKQ